MATDFSKYQTKNITPAGTGTTDFSKYGAVGSTPVIENTTINKPNYFERVRDEFVQSGKDVVSEINRGADVLSNQPDNELISPTQALKSGANVARTVGRVLGEVAGATFSPIVELPGVKQVLEYGGEQLLKIPGAVDTIKYANELAEKNPELAKDAEAIFNITTLGVGKAAQAPIKGEIRAISRDVKELSKIALTPSEEAIQKKVVTLFNKSIKPTNKKTLAQGERYQNQTLEAMRTIKQNSDSLNIEDVTGELITGRTPQTINELAQAVDQTKKLVFEQYDGLAKQANKTGAVIPTRPVADELMKVSQNKALKLTNPELINYADSWAKRLNDLGELDTETTQSVIQNLNNNLQAFYRNPTYDSASKVAIDAAIANNLRKSLDDAIENATGQEYQALKNQYSALKAIENDVTRAAMRDARKNTKGLLDYTDIFTSGQMLSGIVSLNPAMFTKGAVERGFKEYIKYINDPNRAVSNIFKQLDSVPTEKFVPSSATGKFIQNPSAGMSVRAITPEYIAKKVDNEDLNIISKYLESEDINTFLQTQPLIDSMGLKGMDEVDLKRFLQEVVDINGGSRTTKRVLKPVPVR